MTVGEFYYQIGLKFPEKIHGIVPACGGKEVPFRNCNGEWLLYVHNCFCRFSFYMDLNGDQYIDATKTHLVAPHI